MKKAVIAIILGVVLLVVFLLTRAPETAPSGNKIQKAEASSEGDASKVNSTRKVLETTKHISTHPVQTSTNAPYVPEEPAPQTVTHKAEDFKEGNRNNLVVAGDSLRLGSEERKTTFDSGYKLFGLYNSPEIAAAPFRV